MPIQSQLDTLDDVNDNLKGFYEANPEGGYKVTEAAIGLGIETTDTIAGLKNAKQHEKDLHAQSNAKNKAELDAVLAENKEFKRIQEEAKHKKLVDSGDTEALLKSQQEKHDEQLSAKDAKIAKQNASLEKKFVTAEAKSLASELSVDGKHDVLYPHINSRMKMIEDAAGEPQLQILDKEGKPSVATLEDLKAEFKNNPAFASNIKGSEANGGGADGGSNLGNGVSNEGGKSFSKQSIKERAATRKQKRVAAGKPVS